MNKKGFTLIELLAVIVILAVIALIVTPIVTGIISQAKESANARSVEGHIKNVEYAALEAAFKDNSGSTNQIDNTYTSYNALKDAIVDKGVQFPQTGDDVKCASYTIENGTVKTASGCEVSGWGYKFNYSQGTNAQKSTASS